MYRHILLVLLNILITLSSCSKKNYQATAHYSSALSPAGEVLASYVWKETSVVAYKLKGNDTLAYNITRQFDGTDRDDLTTFHTDGTFLFEEGQTKHTPQSSEKYHTGTWQVGENGQTLGLKTARSTDLYEILHLDTTSLMLKLSVQKEDNAYYYIITYSASAKSSFGQQKEGLAGQQIYTEVDQQPQYPGGAGELIRFLRKKQHYPAEARKKGIQGKVVVQFVISDEGMPGEFKVIESLGYGCDEAVLQTCKDMGNWQPGLLHGKPVPVQVTLPVVFKL
jgi:TonB family protein